MSTFKMRVRVGEGSVFSGHEYDCEYNVATEEIARQEACDDYASELGLFPDNIEIISLEKQNG